VSDPHTVLTTAGFRCWGKQEMDGGAVLWQRRDPVTGRYINWYEWAPEHIYRERRWELKLYYHDDHDAVQIQLYSYTDDVMVQRRETLEQKALAALKTLEMEEYDETSDERG
jgi:hypothetical protein